MDDVRQTIEARLKDQLRPSRLEVKDHTVEHYGHQGAADGGGHFHVVIEAAAFQGKSLVEQHQLVYEAVGYPMEGRIHALGIKTIVPAG